MTATYFSTTIGSTGTTTINPPILMAGMLSGGQISGNGPQGGRNLWYYASTNTGADMAVANIITDALQLGMKANDLFFGITGTAGTTNPLHYRGVVCGPITTAGGQISSNLSSGL